MQAFIKKIEMNKSYIEIDVYNSVKRFQYTTKVPKYFLREGIELNVGDKVDILVFQFEKKGE